MKDGAEKLTGSGDMLISLWMKRIWRQRILISGFGTPFLRRPRSEIELDQYLNP
jgi:hypothetical protein